MTLIDLTPEKIEAIPNADIRAIRELAQSLHQGTVGTLDTPLPAAEVEREERLRRALCLKLDESMAWIASQEADLEAARKELRILKGYARSDESRLESKKIGVYVEEKRLREESRSSPTH